MSESGYYPIGAENDPSAPYNQKELFPKEVEVTVSITLSKTVKVITDEYNITSSGLDEDGHYFEDVDFSECDFKQIVKDQIYLPNDGYKAFTINTKKSKKAYNDLKDWEVDDFEVIKN